MLAALGQDVALGTPELGVGVACHSGFDEQNVDIGQVGDVNVVPTGFAGADDRDVLSREDELCQLVDLATSLVDGAPSVSLGDELDYGNVIYRTLGTHRRSWAGRRYWS